MAITFNEIPSDIRVPLFYAELNSGGGVFNSSSRLLLIGQKLAAGTATADEPVLVFSGVEDEYFGANSMLASMVRIAKTNAPFQEVWALPLDDAGAAAAATGTVDLTTLTLPLSASSTYIIYIGGKRFRVAVSTADTAITIGALLAAEINADECSVVTATDNADGTVTITARHAGVQGNNIDIRNGYFGTEPTFANATTITAMAGGTADPDIATALSALGEDEFDWIVMPYTDATNLNTMRDFLDNSVGRWNPMQQLYGHCVSVAQGTVGVNSALGLGRNDPHMTIVGVNGYPTPNWEISAGIGAKMAKHLSDAPELSRPLQFISVAGVMAPKGSDRYSRTDRNTLLYDGIATLTIASDDSVQIERLITTYQKNAAGFEDPTFLDVQTLAQSMYAIRYLRAKVANAHGRQALADDTNTPIQAVSRPRDIKATVVAGYVELNSLAVVENVDLFIAQLIVERNATDANRVDMYIPLDHVNQLRVIAANATSFLQFSEEI